MSTVSTHVLDTALGKPAAGVRVILERIDAMDGAGPAVSLGLGETDGDGRLRELLPAGESLGAGDYRLRFDTGAYFRAQGLDAFYPSVTVEFRVADGAAHYHVPLLLSPFGYSTYRGS
jgi:5-hydroxyisourate hydrolase